MLHVNSVNQFFVVSLSVCWFSFGCCATLRGQQDLSIQKWVDAAKGSYDNKEYQSSLMQYQKAIELGSTDTTVYYNAACCAALIGNNELAYGFLDRAIDLGWINQELLERDSDLSQLHRDQRWDEIIARVKQLSQQNKQRWNRDSFQSRFRANLSDAEKAAGLSKLWAEVKFNFVNFHLVPDLDWDAEFRKCMPKVLASKSTLEYYRLLEQLVAKLKDGHTNVYLPANLDEEFNARPALRTQLIEGRVIIVKLLDSSLAKLGMEIGQEVVKIDGLPVGDYAQRYVEPYMAASTPQDLELRTCGSFLLRGPIKQAVELELLTLTGKSLTVKLPRTFLNRLTRYLSRKPPFSFKMLDNNVAYVRLASFGSDRAAKGFAAAFEKIERADGLILDLRENGGGNSAVGWKILGFLTDKPFQTTQWYGWQYRPTYRAWNRQPLSKFGAAAMTFRQIAKPHFQKPVAMLIGPQTFSAAEDMAAAFDMLDRGKLIGRATGGSTGQPLTFALPGGGQARVCTKHDSYADGTEFVGQGIQPDIRVELKVQDVVEGFDRTLDVALKELLK